MGGPRVGDGQQLQDEQRPLHFRQRTYRRSGWLPGTRHKTAPRASRMEAPAKTPVKAPAQPALQLELVADRGDDGLGIGTYENHLGLRQRRLALIECRAWGIPLLIGFFCAAYFRLLHDGGEELG